MLFVESRELGRAVPEAERPRLLDALAREGFAPLARTTRRRMLELALGQAAHARPELASELERRLVPRPDGAGPLHPGDLFCFADHVLYLVFRDGDSRAGLVHAGAFEPGAARLEEFCRVVARALTPEAPRPNTFEFPRPNTFEDYPAGRALEDADSSAFRAEGWPTFAGEGSPAFDHERSSAFDHEGAPVFDYERSSAFEDEGSAVTGVSGPGAAVQEHGALVTGAAQAQPASGSAFGATDEATRARMVASAALEDEATRALLRRLRDVGAGTPEASDLPALASPAAVGRLVEAGLLRRDVRVSCRRTGHALLDLPAADSLALVTASRARCGLCAAPVADEVIAETLNPTELAAALLDGAAWLRDRVLEVLASLGLTPQAVAAGGVSEHGEACLLTEVCGERFLFFVRDGDLTAEATRRAVARASDSAATHLFAVATGEVEDGARMRLYEFSWRRARDGRDLGVTILEGLGRARTEVGRALDAAARRRLSRELFALDSALGLSAAQLVLAKLKHAAPLAPRLAPASGLALQKWEAAGGQGD